MAERAIANAGRGLLLGAAFAIAAPTGSGAGALYGEEYRRCSQDTTIAIVECLGRATQAWDRRLNAAYRKVMQDEPEAQALRAAQRLWIRYRDANCGYYGAGEGTLVRIQAAACMRAMTEQRARELEDLLAER